MYRIGFSTGAVAKHDFRRALAILTNSTSATNAVELSALRSHELPDLLAAVPDLDLRRWTYVSIHAPSKFVSIADERAAAQSLTAIAQAYQVNIIQHPDAIQDWQAWGAIGSRLCLENMDLRKAVGQTCDSMAEVFDRLPDAGFCFDVGHALQVDPTGVEGTRMLRAFGGRLQQVHLSYVNAVSDHELVNRAFLSKVNELLALVPSQVAIILEGVCTDSHDVEQEIRITAGNLKLAA